ncbi:MAG: hypothetical protein QXG98_01695 [Candidatus Micrarchaeia archaeon]
MSIAKMFAAMLLALAPLALALSANASLVPPNNEVAMGAPSATLSFNITDTTSPPVDRIYRVVIRFPANLYSVSFATVPPAGWSYILRSPGGGVNNEIEFLTEAGSPPTIPPGGSKVFDVVITGRNGAPIPSASTDQLDSTVVIWVEYSSSPSTVVLNSVFWQRRALSASATASPSSVGDGGLVTVVLNVTNGATTTATNVVPSLAYIATGTASASLVSGPTPPSVASLAPGASATFTYVYNASTGASGGTLQFYGNATDGPGLSSNTAYSNIVTVAGLATVITAAPSRVLSKELVNVTMTVRNNGNSTLYGVVPYLSASGTASAALVSGPTPTSIASLAPNATGAFNWVYNITGSEGDYVVFSGNASANGGAVLSPTAQSNPVFIVAFRVTVAPENIFSGDTNFFLNYTVFNGGTDSIDQVEITPPSDYDIGTAHSGPPGWQITVVGGTTVSFRKTSAPYLGPGQFAVFTVHYDSVAPTSTEKNDSHAVRLRQLVSPYQPNLQAYVMRRVPGVALVRITSPANGSNITQYSLFYVTANLTAVNGSLRNCDITLTTSPPGLPLAAGENATKSISFLAKGASALFSWLLNATTLGYYNITVASVCQKGNGTNHTITVGVVMAGATIYSEKDSYTNCGIVYYRVATRDENNILLDSNLSVYIYDALSSLITNFTAATGSPSTGLYDNQLWLNASAQPGRWLIRVLTDGAIGEGYFYVGAGSTELWRIDLAFSPDSISYPLNSNITITFWIYNQLGEGVPGLASPSTMTFQIDGGPNLVGGVSELGGGLYAYTYNASSAGAHWVDVSARASPLASVTVRASRSFVVA